MFLSLGSEIPAHHLKPGLPHSSQPQTSPLLAHQRGFPTAHGDPRGEACAHRERAHVAPDTYGQMFSVNDAYLAVKRGGGH